MIKDWFTQHCEDAPDLKVKNNFFSQYVRTIMVTKYHCFSNPKLPPLKAAQSRAKSKLSVRLDKLGMLAGTSQNIARILTFSFAMSAILLKKVSLTWNHISLFTQLYWSAKVIHFNLGNGATVQLFFCMWHNSSWLLFIDIIMALDLFSRAVRVVQHSAHNLRILFKKCLIWGWCVMLK